MRIQFITTAIISLCFAMLATVENIAAQENDSQVLSAFVAHVESLQDVDQKVLGQVKEAIDEYGSDSVADAITESLIILNSGYADAIEASDGEDVDQAVALLMPFADSDDKFLASDASFYLARMLMNNEQYEQATPLLEKVYGEFADFNVHVGNAKFYTGVAQSGLLQYPQAIETLKEFLQFYPDAPERLRVAAWRQIQQLRSIKEGKMEDVYQRMDYSRRKLSLIDPGEETQSQQKKIVNMLAKLIKEQEKKEASSQSKDNKNTQKQQQKQPQQQQQQQAGKQQSSKSQQGGSSSNANGKAIKKAYSEEAQSPWSRLRDRSRDPANNAIKDKFPARFRDIVERYFEAANGNSNK